MNNVANSIEDLLETLAGLQGQATMQIESSDATIMHSIARQTFRGTALTDRQQALIIEKLQTYREQFTILDYDFDTAVNILRQPLRVIDRSKYIKIVNTNEVYNNTTYESYKENWKWIKIRFPFSKKLIIILDSLNKATDYYHEKGSHEHFFHLTEQNLYNVINAFIDKNFEIESTLLENYYIIKDMISKKEDYIPGVYNFKLKTVTEASYDYITNVLGTPNIHNLAEFYDKRKTLGLSYFDSVELEKSLASYTNLTQKLIMREKNTVMVNSNKYTFNNLANSLIEMKRFPLLVILTESEPLDSLIQVHSAFSGFINNSECTVMFRLDNENNFNFNKYIKDNNLNSPLDKNTKVVYINTNKVPKPLIKSKWVGSTVLTLQSYYMNSNIVNYIQEYDMCVQYDNNVSQYMRSSIQEI